MARRSKGKGRGDDMLRQAGLNVDDFLGMGGMHPPQDDADDDAELERELLALQQEESPSRKRLAATPQKKPDRRLVDWNQLDQMVNEGMRDDDEVSDPDEDDSDLLAELTELSAADPEPQAHKPSLQPSPPKKSATPPTGDLSSVINIRLSMYAAAVDCAKEQGETSKVRRYDRALKTLKSLQRQVQSGKAVSEDDLPPEVAVPTKRLPKAPDSSLTPIQETPGPAPPPVPDRDRPSSSQQITPPPRIQPTSAPDKPYSTTQPSPGSVPISVPSYDVTKHRLLTTRRDQYKAAALEAKKTGDVRVTTYFKTMKQFDKVISALESGQPIDLSKMPGPPPGFSSSAVEQSLLAPTLQPQVVVNERQRDKDPEIQETDPEEARKIFNAPPAANSTLEALDQRLQKYKEEMQKAQEAGNNSKARRLGRIVKQYGDARKAVVAGRPVDFEELPSPPGFAPIPLPKTQTSAPAPPSVAPRQAAAVSPTEPSSSTQPPCPPPRKSPNRPSSSSSAGRPGVQRQKSMQYERQLAFLLERQKQFRVAALTAKKSGDIELAKRYLTMAKGFDPMIKAAENGLPVDLSHVPPPPGSNEDPTNLVPVLQDDDAPSGSREEMYNKLEEALINQIQMSSANSQKFAQLGDVSSTTKFDKWSSNSQKDLDALRNAFKHGDPVPRFHYEMRSFSVVQCCHELGDSDLEICLIRGVQYGLPSGYSASDMDTYVKYDFPFPNDNPQSGTSDTVKNTNCPEYDQSFKLNINRKSRVFARVVKSKSVKFEVYYKRGLFKSDKHLGGISVDLVPFENNCVIHESLDLKEGRKPCGGKLEVKLRIRDPLSGKPQVDELKEKWLIIDHFERTSMPSKPSAVHRPENLVSMEVLKFEKLQIEKQITSYGDRLNQQQLMALKEKVASIQRQIDQEACWIRSGGLKALQEYLHEVERSCAVYRQKAARIAREGNKDKAGIFLRKESLADFEAKTIRQKITPR